MRGFIVIILCLTTSLLFAFDDSLELPISQTEWYVTGIDDYNLNDTKFLVLSRNNSAGNEPNIVLISQSPDAAPVSQFLKKFAQPYLSMGFALIDQEKNNDFARAHLKNGSYELAFRVFRLNNRIYCTCLGLANDPVSIKIFYENKPAPHRLTITKNMITLDDQKLELLSFGDYTEPFSDFKIAFPKGWEKAKNPPEISSSAAQFWGLKNTGATLAITASYFPAPLENFDEDKITKSAIESLKKMSKGNAQEFQKGKTEDGHPFVYTSFKTKPTTSNPAPQTTLFLLMSKKGFFLFNFYDHTILTQDIAMKKAIVSHVKLVD